MEFVAPNGDIKSLCRLNRDNLKARSDGALQKARKREPR